MWTWGVLVACGDDPNGANADFGSVFVQPTLECATVEGDEICAWQWLGACAPEGYRFTDVAECGPIFSQRGYVPGEPYGHLTPADDPRLTDPVYQAEQDWVSEQISACGCVCCHSDSESPAGASGWSIEDPKLWTDGFSPEGLAMMAGWSNSELLMAYPIEDNNGFDRWTTGVPTTDPARMQAFFTDVLVGRGFTEADFDARTPGPAFVNAQRIYEPGPCEDGEGVRPDGGVEWTGGPARYVYVLEEGSENPLPPPIRDEPEGTLWLAEVGHTEAPIRSGEIRYDGVTAPASQRIPSDGAPPELVPGRRYLLYTLTDVILPSTRCLFVAP